MMRWALRIFLFMVCLMASVCLTGKDSKHIHVSDLIIPVNITEVLKHPEAEVVEYFQGNHEDFQFLSTYMLENESVFQTRPVILHQDYGVDKIHLAEQLYKEPEDNAVCDGAERFIN